MAETESASSHLTIALPTQLDQPVTIVAAAGVCDSDFRSTNFSVSTAKIIHVDRVEFPLQPRMIID